MSSQRRIVASRQNGARSRGPKTEAGKRRSAQNAIRHGLLADRIVLENESEENFLIVLDQYKEKFEPADGVEFGMVEEMVAGYWRSQRAFAIERGMFNEALAKQEGTPLQCQTAAYRELGNSPEFSSINRYHSMVDRMFRRALTNLLLVRNIGPPDIDEPTEPNTNSGPSEQISKPEPPTPPTAAAPTEPSNLLTASNIETTNTVVRKRT